MKIYFSLFIFLILQALDTYAQTNSALNARLEIKNGRGMYSKVFLKENGENEAILSSYPVHYKKNGVWEEINTNITSFKGGFQNESNIIQSYFPNNISSSGKIKLIVNSNQEIFIRSEKKIVLLNNTTDLNIQTISLDNSPANVIGNSVKYSNIYPGISDEFTVLNGQIKNNVVLNAPPALLNNVSSGYFGFQETVELPKGWKITGLDNKPLTSSSLLITDSKGNLVLTIPEPVFFDNYGLKSDGSHMVEGEYLVKQENDNWTITTLVPVAWLKDLNTKYPVSIDPTVIIAGTTGGWQSPNNWVDNPGFVFVGVCCGNLTHRAWIKFDVSSIPSQSCITNVEIQTTMATENSTNPELVLINDVTGAFGPYGGIVPAAYNDFGNGFYTSFTITGMGTYGYYSLGASANSLLQSQLPGGWFQVAFQFNNEPSTDWKNMNATSSNLRVTYAAPPCVVLPIELISFDSKCDKGIVNLSWETATETNNDHFTIERSSDGINYEIAGKVAGAGNSNRALHYSFVDAKPLKGTSYYSLKQTDINGQEKNLKLVAVNCEGAAELGIQPNPSAGTFIVEGAKQNSDIIITDLLGKIVFQTKIIEEKTEVDLSNHLNGIYFIQIISENEITSKKIIVNK
jgi:hypothetical protein